MQSFFDENYKRNEAANELGVKVEQLMAPLFAEYMAQGYNPIEISWLMHDAISSRGAVIALTKQHDAIRKRRQSCPS